MIEGVRDNYVLTPGWAIYASGIHFKNPNGLLLSCLCGTTTPLPIWKQKTNLIHV